MMADLVPVSWSLVGLFVGLLWVGYVGAPFIAWTLLIGAFLFLVAPLWLALAIFVPLLLLNFKPLRTIVLSKPIMVILAKLKLVPAISETEKTAIEAGATWVDAELFSGKPNFEKILSESYSQLAPDEQAFLDNEVEEICKMVTDWDISVERDLPEPVWDYLKAKGFLGLIIPKEYGGKGFSAIGQSEVVSKLSTHSIPLTITTMVPNSLGPAELLMHYGTEAQKNHYLPRLADGREIPCFGLTEPGAGSDAGSMTSQAVVFKGEDGKLHLRMNWSKRYITLGAISTLLGLAVKLRDPDNLLGKGEDLGITCVLVPADTKGVILGLRHDPLGVPFYNCPIRGEDVVVSIDQIIGGPEGAGRGWQMLMECLAVGRSISLPAQSAGAAKLTARATGAYSEIRKQFGISIGNFEGIEEALARVGANAYLLEACRVFTCGAVDSGIKPAVVSAIAKLMTTEIARKSLNDGMDIMGGAAISMGPRNVLGKLYQGAPIGITVEGANILTRTMIIFGQGALRCHPYAYAEVKSLEDNDAGGFDKAFWGHVGHVARNKTRALLLSVTRGRLASAPSGPMKRYYQKMAWASSSFAFFADIAMGSLGGSLKFKEKITGRFADILSWMYLGTAVLRRFEAEGRPKEHEAFVHYCMKQAFVEIQKAFDGLFDNLEVPVFGFMLKGPISWWSRLNPFEHPANDQIGHEIAKVMMTPGQARDALTARGLFIPQGSTDGLGLIEQAFLMSYESREIFAQVAKAARKKVIKRGSPAKMLEEAVDAGVITREEAQRVKEAEAMRDNAVQVDSFKLEDYMSGKMAPAPIGGHLKKA